MKTKELLSDNFTTLGKANRVAKDFIAENPTITEENLTNLLAVVIGEVEIKAKMKEFERIRKNVLTFF